MQVACEGDKHARKMFGCPLKLILGFSTFLALN